MLDGLGAQWDDLWGAYESTLGYMGINALLGLSVYAGLSSGQLALGGAGFAALGAYCAALLTLKLAAPFPLALLCGALLPALAAVPVSLPVLRLKGVFLAIATIAFGEVVRLGLVNWDYVNGAQGLVAIPRRASVGLIWACALAAWLLFARLRGSRWGLALEAIRADATAARTLGVDVDRASLVLLILGAGLAGLAGALEAHFTFMVAPGGFAFGRVVDMLVFAVVGGTRSPLGPVLGAAFLTALPEVLREVAPRFGVEPGPLRLMVYGLLLLAVILFLPNGLASLPSALASRWRRRRPQPPASASPPASSGLPAADGTSP